jgi:outer membrane receptor protein involved in Fe transport
VILACTIGSGQSRAQERPPETGGADALELQELEVIGVTPLPGIGTPIERVPSNVQHLTAEELDEPATLGVPQVLQKRVGGVHAGQTQNNPLQPDVTYRGFVGSPLLGTPQGISLFQDGIRVNEFLGDTINWDLIPEDAIASLQIAPGTDPVYGRNTLGSAIAIQTKRGRTHPGVRGEVSGGSFGRARVGVEAGGTRGAVDYFLLGNFVREDGFRDFSDSEVKQLFGELGWAGVETDVHLTYSLARNELRGNAFSPESFLQSDRSSVFTQPDIFAPDLDFLSLLVSRTFGPAWRADADAYVRALDIDQFSADDFSADDDQDGAAEEPLPGINRDTRIEQRRAGGGLQLNHQHFLFEGENSLTAGGDFDFGSADLRLREQRGFIDEERSVVATEPYHLSTDVETDGDAFGLFVTDTWTPRTWMSVTASLRYDRTTLDIRDQLEGDASGEHSFDRWDPAVGVTFRPAEKVGLFARWSRSFRAPTAIELTCASESDPCPLPIALAEDPPLDEVKAETWEVGARAKPLRGLHASFALFRTNLDDDILFVSRSRSAGFFRNVGETRRQGVEVFLDGPVGPAAWFLSYSYTRATFETTETLPSPVGENVAEPGDRLPGVPDHLFKAGIESPLLWRFRGSLDLVYTGEQFLRTDEANRMPPLEDYVTVNAGLEWERDPVTLFARAENLFDAEYETFGSQGENPFAGGRVERFLSPGAPLGGWFGVRVALGAPVS